MNCRPWVCLAALVASFTAFSQALTTPPAGAVQTLNTPRTFPEIKTKAQWQARAREIREQVLVSCGLWPLPDKTPLKANVFGKIVRDGYSVEKVHFQTYPGFYLAGNLYRPVGKGRGPFPGILNPHGHWSNGRMADVKDGSIAARCISFARQGMVAFSYDMVGYNDTGFPHSPTDAQLYQVHRQFGTNRTDLLWAISLMGLQTWNSIRALDFLESLPDVDRKRLACTGESGGGTQTFILGAVDDRLAAQAPIVMVSHTMQGGCSCENAPLLRVEHSNMEIAATPAPRPQILVAATGDWTKDTPTVEGPAIESVYRLFGATDRLRYVRFDFGHNYNQTSREAVYEWFGKWLLHHPNPASLKEAPYQKEPDADLRVFPDGKLPADALTQQQFIESLKKLHQAQWEKLVPRSKASFARFKEVMEPAWRHTLQLESPPRWPQSRVIGQTDHDGVGAATLEFDRPGENAKITAVEFGLSPPKLPRGDIVLVSSDSNPALHTAGTPTGLAARLVPQGYKVLAVEGSAAGEPLDQFAQFYTTYNRTRLQARVRDLARLSVGGTLRDKPTWFHIVLCGSGRPGLWALLAAPAADAVIADCDQLDVSSDEALLAPDLFCPGIRNIGTFEGAAMLAAPHPLLLHNTGDKFPTDAIRATYKALGASSKLRIERRKLADDELADWIARLK